MADKKNPNQELDPQIKANMGQYLKRARPVSEQLNPPKASMPKAPGVPGQQPAETQYEKQGGTGKGRQPPFPIVDRNSLANFQEVKQTDSDTFGDQQLGRFDKELNELALREVAESRGITVDQLLKERADRKVTEKLAPIVIPEGKPVEAPRSFLTPEEEEMLKLEARMAELQDRKEKIENPAPVIPPEDLQRKLADRQKNLEQKLLNRQREEEKLGIPKELHDNPVIERMRKKLSIEALEPATVEINDIQFTMLPPASGMNLWVLEKLHIAQSISGEGAPLALALKIATVCAAICKIEGEPIRDVLGVAAQANNTKDDLLASVIVAETLWEMFLGLPSRKGLFQFDPELAVKLYDPFKSKFGDRQLKTSFEEPIHRYVCPVPDCTEIYDMLEPASGIVPFCKIHGGPTDDKGLVKELRALPLV